MASGNFRFGDADLNAYSKIALRFRGKSPSWVILPGCFGVACRSYWFKVFFGEGIRAFCFGDFGVSRFCGDRFGGGRGIVLRSGCGSFFRGLCFLGRVCNKRWQRCAADKSSRKEEQRKTIHLLEFAFLDFLAMSRSLERLSSLSAVEIISTKSFPSR